MLPTERRQEIILVDLLVIKQLDEMVTRMVRDLVKMPNEMMKRDAKVPNRFPGKCSTIALVVWWIGRELVCASSKGQTLGIQSLSGIKIALSSQSIFLLLFCHRLHAGVLMLGTPVNLTPSSRFASCSHGLDTLKI